MKIVYKAIFITVFLLSSCGSSGDDSPPPPDPEPEVIIPDPKATTLLFPENNTECNEGVIVNDQTSRVTFRWQEAADTDIYEIYLRDLDSNTEISVNSGNLQIDLNIKRGAPYEWYVVSTATGNSTKATSASFKFYNQGPGIVNYAPFPADVVNPSRGSEITNSTTILLEWLGSDIDNDIVEYEIFFGIDADPNQSIGTTSEQTFETNIVAGNTYYWRVKTTDSASNTSLSEIFEFKVAN